MSAEVKSKLEETSAVFSNLSRQVDEEVADPGPYYVQESVKGWQPPPRTDVEESVGKVEAMPRVYDVDTSVYEEQVGPIFADVDDSRKHLDDVEAPSEDFNSQVYITQNLKKNNYRKASPRFKISEVLACIF